MVNPESRVLLTTDSPGSDKTIGWVYARRKARTAYLQPGHMGAAFQNPSYRTTILRAIRWAAAPPTL